MRLLGDKQPPPKVWLHGNCDIIAYKKATELTKVTKEIN